MLTFIGLGINPPQSLTIEGVEAAKNSDAVYAETYTSPASTSLRADLQQTVGKEITSISRVMLEDGREILNEAMNKNVSLFVPGDPMVATTHSDLKLRAMNKGIETKIIHSSSVVSSLAGELGLHIYKFGKITTLTRQGGVPLLSSYNVIYENLLRRLHTLLLLEYDSAQNFFLSPSEGLLSLLETEKDQGYGVLSDETFAIVCSRVGMRDQLIECGTFGRLVSKTKHWREPPHTIVIPGELHFTEEESLRAYNCKSEDAFPNNARSVRRRSESMISKYVPKTLRTLQAAREQAKEKNLSLENLFENVELYASDAKRFLNEGRDELAILSIGYAEGLLDSLRFSDKVKLEW